jgi:DNA polymerase-3 subunit gamma/tau
MFENLLGQDTLVRQLSSDVSTGTLPGSLLFEGPEYSGKMTAALELARVLSCKGNREWNCSCGHCVQNRLLVNPQVLMTGGRYFAEEIAAGLALIQRNESPAARYLFIRNLRKLLRRFDSVVWEGDDKKIQPLYKHMERINERIELMAPDRDIPPVKQLAKMIEEIRKDIPPLVAACPQSVPIHQVRSISAWAHRTVAAAGKVVIFENADRMQEGSRNALLKILEEPTKGLTLILTAVQRRLIIPTILSRVRVYSFKERSPAIHTEVIERIYRDSSDTDSLRDYFRKYRDKGAGEVRKDVAHFLLSAQQGDHLCPGEGREKIEKGDFIIFLEELTALMSDRLRQDPRTIPLRVFESWNREIRKVREGVEIYNMSPRLLRERLYYAMRDAR